MTMTTLSLSKSNPGPFFFIFKTISETILGQKFSTVLAPKQGTKTGPFFWDPLNVFQISGSNFGVHFSSLVLGPQNSASFWPVSGYFRILRVSPGISGYLRVSPGMSGYLAVSPGISGNLWVSPGVPVIWVSPGLSGYLHNACLLSILCTHLYIISYILCGLFRIHIYVYMI